MMTVERTTVAAVQEEVKEFFEHLMDQGEDVSEFNEEAVTQAMVNEMNEEIDGFDHKTGSASSYVPKTIWDVLVDEDLVSDEYEDRWLAWYEEKHA